MSPPQAGREAVASPCSPLGALWAHRCHPDRGIGALHRFRTERDVVEAEVVPVMTEVVLGEAPLDNRQRLIRAPKGFCAGRGRGRDAGYPAPPAQIPACGTTAPGSCLGSNAPAQSACRTQSCACDRVTRPCVRPLWCVTRFPLASPLLSTPSANSGAPEPLFEGFVDTMGLSDSLHPSITVVPRRFTVRTWRWLVRPDAGPPGFRTQCFRACQRSPSPPRASTPCHHGVPAVAFRVCGARQHPGLADFGAPYSACTFPCQRFACAVTDACA